MTLKLKSPVGWLSLSGLARAFSRGVSDSPMWALAQRRTRLPAATGCPARADFQQKATTHGC